MIQRVLLLLFLAAAVARAADSPDLLAVDSAFVNGQYEEVELLVLRTLQSNPALPQPDVARLNLTAGYSMILLGREDDARRYFNRALDAEPETTLDPVQVSPKFRIVFDEVKASRPAPVSKSAPLIRPQSNDPAQQAAAPQPSLRGALLANLVLPGSGLFVSGRRLEGVALFAAQAATTAILVTQIGKMRDSRAAFTSVNPTLTPRPALMIATIAIIGPRGSAASPPEPYIWARRPIWCCVYRENRRH